MFPCFLQNIAAETSSWNCIVDLKNKFSCFFHIFSDHSNSFFKTHLVAKIIILSAIVLLIVIIVVALVSRTLLQKQRRKRGNSEELRKAQLSQGSLSHSEDDKNPDLIPQSTSNYQNIDASKMLELRENAFSSISRYQIRGLNWSGKSKMN